MAIINIVALDKEARAALTNLEYSQFPYALAKTLSEMGKGSMNVVRRITKFQFKLHGDFIPHGIKYISAKKSDIRTNGIGQTEVFTMPRISGFMPIHEVGGTRDPGTYPSRSGAGRDKGKSIALPGSRSTGGNIEQYNFKTGTGAIKRRWHPRTLLAGSLTGKALPGHTQKVSRGGRKGKPFIVRGRASGVPMLVRRRSKSRYPIEVLYIFAKSAKYPPIWQFEPTVKKYVDKHFQERLKINLEEAVRNA